MYEIEGYDGIRLVCTSFVERGRKRERGKERERGRERERREGGIEEMERREREREKSQHSAGIESAIRQVDKGSSK